MRRVLPGVAATLGGKVVRYPPAGWAVRSGQQDVDVRDFLPPFSGNADGFCFLVIVATVALCVGVEDHRKINEEESPSHHLHYLASLINN